MWSVCKYLFHQLRTSAQYYRDLIRSRGGTNNNPMLFEFNATISKMLSMKIITSKNSTGNCEREDNDDYLVNVVEETKQELADEAKVCIENYADIDIAQVDEVQPSLGYANENALRYFTGYVVYKSQVKYNCDTCSQLLKEDLAICAQSELFLFNKNFKSISNNFKLKAPSDDLFNLMKLHYTIFHKCFQNYPYARKIKQTIVNECIAQAERVEKYSSWYCERHGRYFEMINVHETAADMYIDAKAKIFFG